MINPYSSTHPVNPSEFAGREDEIRKISGYARDSFRGRPANVFIEGEWGIGKTSLLWRLQAPLEEENCVVRTKVQKTDADLLWLLGSIFRGIFDRGLGKKGGMMTDQGRERRRLVAEFESWWKRSVTVFPINL